MGPRFRKAWVTFAVDKKSAENAIVLAQSLTRVATIADIVVITSNELFHGEQGKQLCQYFDVVLPQNVDTLVKDEIDHFKNLACNLQMYSTCIVVDSNKMVVKNCDELFGMENDFAAVTMQNRKKAFDVSVFVIRPKFYFQHGFSGLLSIDGLALSDAFSDFFEREENRAFATHLHLDYNYVISDWLPNFDFLHTAKIIELGCVDLLKKNMETNSLAKEIIDSWISFYEMSINNIHFDSSVTPKHPLAAHNETNGDIYKDAIAIVGHSCRFPAVNSTDEFWDLLKSGRDGISHIPSERLLDFQRNDSRFTESWGGFLKCPIDEFDAQFFGISPREATFMDPQQRLLLEVAWEGLENAAINPQTLKGGNTGVFTGVWQHDYERLVGKNASVQDFHHVILGNAFSATSARVSYFLGLNGPNIAIESGCSSSMIGLHLACESLRKEETNLCLVLGANILAINIPSSSVPILAKDGRCKTYDEKADGFARAEGIAGIVLKRFSDAIKNGDRILGVVRGSGVTNEGTSCSFGTPSKHCQEVAVREALKNAGLHPGDVDYVEAHGTGTPVGDPIEFAALSAAYAGGNREKPLMIGSVKTNTGHTEAAAGLAGLIKVLLSLQHETIPPHINFTTINPNIDLQAIPAKIPIVCENWIRNPNRKRIAGISSFGISGGNVHVIVEEPPVNAHNMREISPNCQQSHHIFAISAKSENALADLSKSYVEFFRHNPKIDLADAAYTANTGRANFKFRSAFVAKDIPELISALDSSTFQTPALQTVKPKIAFLFTGQGSQYFGMGKELHDSNMIFRNAFDKCNYYLQDTFGISLKCALWDDTQKHLLEPTMYSQLSIFAVEYSLLKLWESFGVQPEFILGHSVGEYAAAVAAEILSLNDALALLVARCKLVDTVPEGGMLAVKASRDIVMELISELSSRNSNISVDIACANSSNETVVAGNKNSVLTFQNFVEKNGHQTQLLISNRAFHSRDMDSIVTQFEDFSTKLNFNSPNLGYVSGKTGKILSPGEINSSYWAEHMRDTVNFQKGMEALFDHGCNVFVEIGSHPTLLALGMSSNSYTEESVWLPSLRRNESCWKTILESLGKLFTNGSSVNWKALDQFYPRKKLELPTYPFQRRKYWTESRISDVPLKLHPLLGRKVPLADQNLHIYENFLDLREFEYLKDHQVANIIILPAAVYLEMALACGRDIYKEIRGLTVVDFTVEAPLELEVGKRYRMQTMVFPADGDGKIKLQIFVYQVLNGSTGERGWKLYSGAVLAPKSEGYDSNIKECTKLDHEIVDDIKLRCEATISPTAIYKYSAEAGFYFGPEFQTITTVWKGIEEFLVEIQIPIKDCNITNEKYVYHPLLLDAMIQVMGLVFSFTVEDEHICLPVAIEKFTLIESCETFATFFVHVNWNSHSKGSVFLYNERKTLIAVMDGVRLVRTSLNSFLNVINTMRNKLPGMYQENWRSRDAPLNSRVDLSINFNDSRNIINEISQSLKNEKQQLKTVRPLLDKKYCTIHILKFLFDVGWNPKVNDCVDTRSFVEARGFVLSVENIISRFFGILCEDGYLRKESTSSEWAVVKKLPSAPEVEAAIQDFDLLLSHIESVINERHVISFLVKHCISHLPKICAGEITPHSLLFGNEDPNFNALSLYTDSIEMKYCNCCLSLYFQIVSKQLIVESKNSNNILRIIEIGAGSGATTKEIINGLKKSGISFRYTFTDISSHFLMQAKGKFADENNIEYKILDIEQEPLVQGFAPYHYDVLVASNVIHATSNLHVSISNIRLLLRNRGFLMIHELLEGQRPIDILFGTLDSYWRFNDYDIRPDHPCVSKDVWDRVLLNCGFEIAQQISEDDTLHGSFVCTSRTADNFYMKNLFIFPNKKNAWILFCDTDGVYEQLEKLLCSVGRQVFLIKDICDHKIEIGSGNCFYVNATEYGEVKVCLDEIFNDNKVEGFCYLRSISDYSSWEDQRTICAPGLNMLKYLISHNCVETRFCAATNGVYYTPNQKIMSPHKSTLVGMFKSASNEFDSLSVKVVELDPAYNDANIYAAELFHELFAGDDLICSYRANKKSVLRINHLRNPDTALPIPMGRYAIVGPASKKIKDLKFNSVVKSSLRPDEVEVLVKCVAINFRDLFVVLQPDGYKSKYEKTIGSDYAGIVSDIGSSVTSCRIGDKVFGAASNACVASHVIVDERAAIAIPLQFTFSEACTLPSVFLTAYLCLVTTANLKEGETILIHVASGGIGMIAIEIAKYLGAHIIATAGSHRKRTYLRSLGIEHVFHSRDLTYEKGIKNATNNKGVDVVLNSLTGPGFKEATLRVCAVGARFVEMGKMNIWTQEEVKELRSDVQYTIIDLETIDHHIMKKALESLNDYFNTIEKCPMPYTHFPVSLIREAFNYFAKAEHIGKIVLTMPEIREVDGQQYLNHFHLEDCATYLITGGLTGIGLEVAKWMVDIGAKNIVLIARSPPNENALKEISILRSKGCRVESFEVDVGDWEQCSRLFDIIQSSKNKWPSLKGIIHSAVVLCDELLANQTWENFETVFKPKVAGGWNLHLLSKNIILDHFVMFSSVSASVGTVGQSNYSAACLYLDSLVQYRHSLCLPAQTINWGAWAQVGKSSNIEGINEGRLGVTFFNPSQGIAALEYIMSRPCLKQVAVAQLDPKPLINAFGKWGNYLEDLVVEDEDENLINQATASTETFWAEMDSLDLAGRVTYIKKHLEKVIKKTLRLPNSDTLDEFQTFSDMGLDSLMGIEIKNKLQTVVGKRLILNASSLLDYPTIHTLSQYLAEQTLNIASETIEMENDHNLIELDSILPEDIRGRKEEVLKPTDVRNILFTGSTGRFGIYILRDLMKMPNLKLYCLIRGKSNEQAKKKLVSALKKFKLQNDVDVERLSIIVGNIAEIQLGLTQEIYDDLSAKVDSVFHLAVKGNHIEKYLKLKSGRTDIRSVNVLGTVNILRFSSNIKTKRVFYSSTYTTVNRLNDDGFVNEDFPDEDNIGDKLSWGYVLSKFVCEKLLKQASDRGIPCTVVRYFELTGDSQTGVFSIENNSFMNWLLMCLRYGVVTEIEGGWCFMPADVASEATVKLLFNDYAEVGVYNFTPPNPMYVDDFVETMSADGYPLKKVGHEEFGRIVTSDKENDAWISIFIDSYGSDMKNAMVNATAVGTILKDKKRVYQISDRLLKAVPHFQTMLPEGKLVIKKYVQYAQSSGMLKNITSLK